MLAYGLDLIKMFRRDRSALSDIYREFRSGVFGDPDPRMD
jgi:hypothetical protein